MPKLGYMLFIIMVEDIQATYRHYIITIHHADRTVVVAPRRLHDLEYDASQPLSILCSKEIGR